MLRPRGSPPARGRELETRRCGELRWSEREGGWEVFIPCVAFKNSGSAYFSKRPFRLQLPDLRAAPNVPNAIAFPITRYDVADHLGMAVETVSRTMTVLRRRGSIALKTPRDIEIRDAAMLSDNVR